jgi:rsbT antagonist protein RsbS
MNESSAQRIPLQISHDCVIASIQIDLTEEVLNHFQSDLLARLHAVGARGVILDLSGVEIMDLEDFRALRRTMLMAEVMGARSIITGLRSGVVSALVALNADTEGIEATQSLDDAFRLMEERSPKHDFADSEGLSNEERPPEDKITGSDSV